MNNVIAPKWSTLKPKLVAATMFLKLNMSLIPNNPIDVAESPIWNTLIPSHPRLPDDIDDCDDNENDDDDDDEEEEEEEEEEKEDLSPVPVKSEETEYTC
jgi:hypothetical protein